MPTTHARAALVREYRAPFAVEDIQLDGPREDEVRVRMVGSGICHTDLVFREGSGFALPTPCILGHEGAGVVEAVGSKVSTLDRGDHVVLTFLSCGSCPSCKRDIPAYCAQLGPLNYSGGRIPDGSSPAIQNGNRVNAAFFSQSSFATHAIAKARNAIRVSKDASLEVLAPLACGFQTGAGAVLNAIRLKKGESLAVFGGGAVGLSAQLAAIAAGASSVIVVEPKENRRSLALELGATHALDPAAVLNISEEIKRLTNGGVHHAIDATGIPSVVAQAADVLLPMGVLVTAGIPPMDANLPINMLGIMSRGISIKGTCEGDADPHKFIPHLVDLYQKGRFPIDRLVTRFPFERINDAVLAAERGNALKAVLTFGAF